MCVRSANEYLTYSLDVSPIGGKFRWTGMRELFQFDDGLVSGPHGPRSPLARTGAVADWQGPSTSSSIYFSTYVHIHIIYGIITQFHIVLHLWPHRPHLECFHSAYNNTVIAEILGTGHCTVHVVCRRQCHKTSFR